MRISIFASKELQAVAGAMRVLDRETKKAIRKQTKDMIAPEWQRAVAENVTTRLEARVLERTARVRVSDQNVTLSSASVGRSLSGGLKPSESFAAVEFGADDEKVTYTATSRRGRSFQVTRNTRGQLRNRNRKGYVVYPAAADIIPRLASLWVQTVMRGTYDALEARRG
jgi:hypothetical protein